MRNFDFAAWKQDMAAHGMLDSVSHITTAPLEDYWRFTTACDFFKQVFNNSMDLRLGNYLYKDVEGALHPGETSVLPLPGPDDNPFPIPDLPTSPPYLPTEAYFYKHIALAEGGPGDGVGGVPRGEAAFLTFVENLWSLPSLEDFQAVAKRTAVQVAGKTTTVFDFFNTVSGGDWPTLYKNVKLAIGGQRDPAVAYFSARFDALPEGASWESWGSSIGAAVGGVAGALAAGGATGGTAAIVGGGAGSAVGGCVGATVGSWFDKTSKVARRLVA